MARLAAPYAPRRPTETALYALVRDHLETFLAYTREQYERGLPRYVEDELRAGRALFQVKENRELFIIDDTLAASFERAALTGLQILGLAHYDPS